ncbi:hypothetical protein CYMTET_2863 [Cymbomonas tetramitiformis]|uniref:Core Histone H2A/H2B/H3 domain-containing protein n=1 Tax=Cymbomonas tetramitiformis TaxID=36881 RepID=A0AAE0H4A7_9CHLO|nr:hypothetical protein CYMTET_2863 [Cymbomonas tetramitiformis]
MPRIKQTRPNRNGGAPVKTLVHASAKDTRAKASADASRDASQEKKKRRKRPGTGALLEMRRLQKKDTRIIAKAPFRRLVTSIMRDCSMVGADMRIQGAAVKMLRESASKYMHHVFVMGSALCVKDRRQKLNLKDFVVAANIVSGEFTKCMEMRDACERLLAPVYDRPLRALPSTWPTVLAKENKPKQAKNETTEKKEATVPKKVAAVPKKDATVPKDDRKGESENAAGQNMTESEATDSEED